MKKTWENSVDWESDKASSCCTLCTKKFGMLLQRRHHCRSCGRLVCGACSSNKVRIEDAADNRQVDDELQRVCDPCYQIITAKEEKISQEIKQRERKMELLSVTSYLSNCMVDIFFLDGKYKTLCFEETTTIGDLASQLYPNAKLAMFEVFQDMFDGNQYTYLSDTDIISDVVSRWRDERKKYVKIVLPVYDSKAVRPINSVIKKNALSDGDLQAFRQRDSVSHAQESDVLRAAEDRIRVLQMEACTLQQELRKANAKIETWRAIYGKTNKTRGLEKTGYSYDVIEEDDVALAVKTATFADGPSTPQGDKSTGGDTTPMGNKRESFSWGLRQSFFKSPSSKAPLPSDTTATPHDSSAGTSSEATIEPTLSRTRSSIGEPQLAGMGGRKASRSSFFVRRSSYTAESAPSLSVELDSLPQIEALRLQRQSSMNSDAPDALSIIASVPFGCNPVETELLTQQASFLTRSEDDVATFVRTFFNHVVSIEGFVSKYEVFFEQIMKIMQDRDRQLYSDIDQPVSMWLVVIYQMVTSMDTTYECLMEFVEILRPNLRNWLTTLLRLFATFPISNPEALRSIFHLLWKEHLLFEEEVQTVFSQSMIASFCKDIDGMNDPMASSSDSSSSPRLPGSPHLHHSSMGSGSHPTGAQYIHSIAGFAQQLLQHQQYQQQQQQHQQQQQQQATGSTNGSNGSAPVMGSSLSIGQLSFTTIDKFMTNIINTLQYIIADLLELIPKEFQIMLMFQRLSWQVWEEIIKPWYRQQATDLKFFQALSIYQFLETYGDLIGQFGVDHRKLSERIKLKKGEVYKLACSALVTDLQAVWRQCSATGTEMVASNQQPLLYQTSSSMKSLSSGGSSDQQAAIAMSLASVASSQQSVHLSAGNNNSNNNNNAGHAVMMMRWSDELLAFVNDVIRRLVHYVEPSQKSNIRMTVLILLFETLNELGPQQLEYLRTIRPTDADYVVRYTAFVNSQIVFMTSLADTQEQAVDRISEELSEALDQKATMIIQRHEEHCEVALEGLAHIWRDQIYDTCRGELLKSAWLSDAKIMHSLKKMMKQQLQGFQQGLVEDLQYSLRMRMRLTGYICEGLVHAYVECLLRNEPGATLSIATIARLNEDLQWLTALIEECRVMMLGTDDIHRVAPSMSPGFETKRRKRLLPFGGNRTKPSPPKSPLPTSSAGNNNNNDASTPPPPPPPSTVSLISSPTEALRKAINYTNKQVYDTMLQPLTHLILALQMDKQYLIPFVQEELFRDFGYHCIRVWIVIEHWRGEKKDHIQQEYDAHLKHWRPAVDTLVEPRVDVGYIKDLRIVKSIKIQPLAPLIGGDDR